MTHTGIAPSLGPLALAAIARLLAEVRARYGDERDGARRLSGV